MTDTPLAKLVEVLDRQRVPVNRVERAERVGDVPYYGATGQVGWIDDFLFDEELVLLGEDGVPFLDPTKPKAYIVRGKSWVNNHAHVLRARSDAVSAEYLCHALNSVDYTDLVNGTTRLKLTKAAMLRISLQVPPLDEQRRVVRHVGESMAGVAAARRSLEAAVRNLAFLRRAVVDRSADPDQWELRDLGDLLAVGLMNGRSVPTADDGFPVLRLTSLRKGVVDLEQSKTGAWTASEAFPYLVRGGDFLVARGNGSLSLVGRGGLVEHQSPPPVAFPDTVIRVQVDDDTIRRDYLRLIWDSRLIREQIEQQAHTTAGIYKINQTMLRALQLPVPPIAEQDRLVRQARESLSGVDELETILHRQTVAGGQLQRSVLRAVIMGKLAAPTSEASAVQRAGAVYVRGASE